MPDGQPSQSDPFGADDIILYRSVSEAERDDIVSSDAFRPGRNNALGKWFAESREDAVVWGNRLRHEHVVAGRVPRSVAERMFRNPHLDFIGPARFAENEHLAFITPVP